MPFDPHPIAYSVLTSTPGLAGTSATVKVGDGALFAVGANATVRFRGVALPLEIVRVTAVNGDALTLARAQEGTTALSILAGWEIFQSVTAKSFTDIETALTTAQATLAATTTTAATTAIGQTNDAAVLAGTVTTTGLLRYNVRAYGALGNNSSHDEVGIQAALDAAVAAGGGTVHVPAGTYRLYGTLTLLRAHNIHLVGETSEGEVNATKLVWYGTPNVAVAGDPTAGSTMLVLDKCRECTIEDLSFLPSAIFGIAIDNSTFAPHDYTDTNNTFRGLNIQTLAATSIGLRLGHLNQGNADREVIDRCIFNGNGAGLGYGIKIEDAQVKEVSIHDCLFSFIGYGIYASWASFSLYDNNFEHLTIANVAIINGGDHVVDVGSMSEGAPAHLLCTSGNNAVPYLMVGGRQSLDFYNGDPTTSFNYIQYGTRGMLTLLGVNFGDNQPYPGFRIAGGFQNWGGQVHATGCSFPNPTIFSSSSLSGCSYSLNNNQCASSTKPGYSIALPDSKGSTTVGTQGREPPLVYGGLAGGLTNVGLRLNGGGMQIRKNVAPQIASVTPTLGAATTYSYYVVAVDVAGNKSLASATVTTTVGPTTLDSTHYNTISWYHAPGGFTYDVIRAVGGLTQGSIALGLADESLIDNGLAASSYTAVTRSASADSSVDGLWTTKSRAAQIRSVAGNDTATLDDNYLVCATAMTETLPTAPPDGFEVTIKRMDATNATTVASGGSDVIELAGVTTTSRSLGSNGAALFLKYKASTLTWYSQTQGTVT